MVVRGEIRVIAERRSFNESILVKCEFPAFHFFSVEMGANTLVLDEVQDILEWERFVTGCLDMGRRVLVTGANAKMLSRELGT